MGQNYELAPPPAQGMLESLRGVGYSPAAAIADIVDNSVSAGASNVWVRFSFDGPGTWITITDDGRGMDEAELRAAMRLGDRNPNDHRDATDLGRFGLGLKTASFSQCRCLTVASRRQGLTAVRRWDLDYVGTVNEWRLLDGARPDATALFEHLERMDSGTVVIWQALDRLTAGMARSDRASEDQFLSAMEQVERHLAMVFHRFLEGPQPRLRMFMNGARVEPWDPFLRDHPARQASPVETMWSTANSPVELQGFVLPHKDNLSGEDFERGSGPNGWTAQQGFYVYRNERMLVAGGWLGLGAPRTWTMEEPFKLARLLIDFRNTDDHEWDIDVKKSVARPPRWLRPRITALAESIRVRARRVFAHRGSYGRRPMVPELNQAWLSVQANGSTTYRINRSHPAVRQALEAANLQVEDMLRVIEETVPIQRIWLDAVEKGEIQKEAFSEVVPAEIEDLARRMLKHLTGKVGMTRPIALSTLRSTEPFQIYPALIDAIAREEATS